MAKKAVPAGSPDRFIPYPMAMVLLSERLAPAPTPAELAAWVFMGPDSGGLVAYTNANELTTPPPRFCFDPSMGDDYVRPLMKCWFREGDIKSFKAPERYVTWSGLIEEWDQLPDGYAADFVRAKIAESRLIDVHPVTGVTRGTFPENESLPPIETGLFMLSQVRQISARDFGLGQSVSGTKTVALKPGVPAKLIWEHFCFWDKGRWKALLSSPQPWLVHARVGAVARYKAAAWNPASIAVCLWDYREKHIDSGNKAMQKYARAIPTKKELERIVQTNFPEWVAEVQFDLE